MRDPSASATALSRPLLERQQELARLRELADAAVAGQGGAAIVVGSAGIGKTSLLDATAEHAREAGIACLSARGGELERAFSYGIVSQLFESAVSRLSDADSRRVFSGAAARAASVVGLGSDPEKGEGADSEDARFAVLHGLYWLSVNLSELQPLLLLVDDLHWSDAASMRFLAYLQRRIEEHPIGLIVATRPALDSAPAEFTAIVDAIPEPMRLAPAPLTEVALGEIVSEILGAHADEELIHACQNATAGNPFLCIALASALAERSIRPGAESSDDVAALAGQEAAGLVRARLGRLPEGGEDLLRAVAVLGRRATLNQAARLAGLDQSTAARTADGLAAQGVLEVGLDFDFVHPLVRAAVRDEIPAVERALMHGRAARLLAGDAAPVEDVATQLLVAHPSADPWAVDMLREAARKFLVQGDPRAARSSLQRALDEPPDPDTRQAVLRELAAAEVRDGDPESATTHLEQAKELVTDTAEQVAIRRELSAALSIQGRFEPAAAELEAVLADVGVLSAEEVEAVSADLLIIVALGPAPLRESPAGRDHALRERSGRTPRYLAALALEAALRGDSYTDAQALAERAQERGIVEELGSGAIAWIQVVQAAIAAGSYELAQTMIADAFTRLRENPSAVGLTRAQIARASLNVRRGAIEKAIADAQLAVERGRELGFSGWPYSVSVLVEALTHRGELDAAESVLRETGLDGPIPDRFAPNDRLLEARGGLHLARGEIEGSIADLEELGRRLSARGISNPSMFDHGTGLSLALLRKGDLDGSQQLASEQLKLARTWGAPREIGISLRTMGLCEASDIELLGESVDVLTDSGARLEQARSLVELGAAIRRTGKRADAREPLRQGMELAHLCGAVPLVEQAREELVATGARPRRITRSGVDSLTPSELRVARMAADGMTNREIAQALYVTLRTVQTHLTHSYQKLDIASREELRNALAGHESATD